MPKKIYIAGPMTGYPQYNFTAFLDAEEDLTAKGWEVLSPARMDLRRGFNPIENPDAVFTPEMLTPAIRMNIDAIRESDAIAMLDNWSESKGAKAEYYVARWAGLKIFRYYQRRKQLFTLSGK